MIKNTFSVSTSSASFSSSFFSLTPTPSSTPVAGDRCYSSEGRFGNGSSFNFYPGSRSVAAGRVEVCPNSRVFTPVCSDAVDDEFANAFCQSVYGSNYCKLFCCDNYCFACNYSSLFLHSTCVCVVMILTLFLPSLHLFPFFPPSLSSFLPLFLPLYSLIHSFIPHRSCL